MLRIGWATRDFTPQRPALLQGQMHIRIAREAVDPLSVTALAVDGGRPDSRAIMISCDLAMIPEALQAEVRKRLGAHPVVAPVGPEGGQELVEATIALIGEVSGAALGGESGRLTV